MANRLSMLESMVNTGALSPECLNLDISNDQQLADINAWLARLCGSIPQEQPNMYNDPMMDSTMDSYNSCSDFLDPKRNYTTTDVMLQSFNDHDYFNESKSLYPSVAPAEHDMYVRSDINMPPSDTPLSSTSMSGDYNATTPTTCLYGAADCYTGDDSLSQFGYPSSEPWRLTHPAQHAGDFTSLTTGVRHHYTPIPNVASGCYFTHDIRTAMNFTSGNPKHKRVPTKSETANPTDGQVEKKNETGEAIKPTKVVVTHEDKKNLATLLNVFASFGDPPAASKSKPPSEQQPTDDNDDKMKPNTEKETNRKIKKALDEDVMELLVSDMTKLELREKTVVKKDESVKATERSSLYPTTSSSIAEPSKDQVEPLVTKSAADRHRLLLQQITRWVNESYAEKKKQQQQSSGPKSLAAATRSVPVQWAFPFSFSINSVIKRKLNLVLHKRVK